MQISTNLMFDRATSRMMDVQQRLTTAQAQMATGKEIIQPSDAPQKASAIQRLQDEITRQESHLTTLGMATRRFDTEETAMRSASDVLIRMKELTLSAANATKNGQAHTAIAAEMANLRDELISLANTRDDSGNYIFSGTRVSTKAYVKQVDGTVVFQGDQTQTFVPAGVERDVIYTRSGSDVFKRVVRDDGEGGQTAVGFFEAVQDMVDATEGQDVALIQRSVTEVDSMIEGLALSLSAVGSDTAVINSQTDVLETNILRLKTSLSQIEDLDYTKAVTQMSKDTMALQAAQSSFAKISQLSLFDYIR